MCLHTTVVLVQTEQPDMLITLWVSNFVLIHSILQLRIVHTRQISERMLQLLTDRVGIITGSVNLIETKNYLLFFCFRSNWIDLI